MGTISNLFGGLCFVAMLGHWCTDRHLLNQQNTNYTISKQRNNQKFKQLLEIARSQIGIREATGKNDGKQVEAYLNYTGNKKGEPWCASFVSWVFGQVGFKEPRTAWSPALFPKARLVKVIAPATVFGIYFQDKGRVAHVGLVESHSGDWLYTIEGNTNMAGSREGDGVYRKMRHKKTVRIYADWIKVIGEAR